MSILMPGIEPGRFPERNFRCYLISALVLLLICKCGDGRPRIPPFAQAFSKGLSGEDDSFNLEGTRNMSQLLETQLEELNGDARETARLAGASAIPTLNEHRKAESASERALTLECFAEIGGDEAVEALAEGLEDDDFNVRKMAVLLLHSVHTPIAIPRLRKVVSQSPDEWVRGNAALILGRLDDPDSVPVIKRQMASEVDPQATQQMTLAVARLEDGEEREIVLSRLSADSARERYNAIEDFEYLSKADLMRHLAPLLSDTREVINIGTEPYPVWHRVCDRAVDAVAVVSGQALPFPVGGRTYSEGEIQQARDFILGTSGRR